MPRKLSEVTGVKGDIRGFGVTDALVDSKTLVGIEVEMERAKSVVDRAKRMVYWSQVSEGSLRNNGIEIVTPPVMGSDITAALDELKKMIDSCSPKPEITERTGLHVHLDFREESVPCLFRFLVIYLIFENLIFAHCEDGRNENPYCVPLGECEELLASMTDLTSSSAGKSKNYIKRFPKYTALNIGPLVTLGTVEVRSHEGTLDSASILTWINLLLSMKMYAKNKEKSPQELIDLVCSNPERYFQDVFGKYSKIPFDESLREGMLRGARSAQHMYRAKPFTPEILQGESMVHDLYKDSEVKKSVSLQENGAPLDIVDLPVWTAGPNSIREAMAREERIMATYTRRVEEQRRTAEVQQSIFDRD